MSADTHWNTGNMVYGDSPVKLGNGSYAPNMLAVAQNGNLYAYALNNPVMYGDSGGEFVIVIAGIAVGGKALMALGGAVLLLIAASDPNMQRAANEAITDIGNAARDARDYVRDSIGNGIDAIGDVAQAPPITASSAGDSKPKTIKIADIQASQAEVSQRVYRLAYAPREGGLNPIGPAMTYDEAVAVMYGTGAYNTITKLASGYKNSLQANYGRFWGIYTNSQSHAKALALAGGIISQPEVHGGGQGYYGHYHDKNHTMHVWFGDPYYW